jgi:hypothetical protein
VDWIHLVQHRDSCQHYRTPWFSKIMGTSSLAEPLFASQEGLRCVEVSQPVTYQCEKEYKLKTTSRIIFLRDLYAITSSTCMVELILIVW